MINEKQQIEFIKTYLIPFVNAKTDDEKKKYFDDIVKNGIWHLFDETNVIFYSENDKKRCLDSLTYDSEIVYRIHETVRKMIRIALIDGEFKKIYSEERTLPLPSDLEKIINESLKYTNISTRLFWRGKGYNCGFSDFFLEIKTKNRLYKDFIKEVEAKIIKVLVDFFQSGYIAALTRTPQGDIESIPRIYNGIGYQYFNICPKCEKFFYKKRKDQVYCSEKCSNAERQNRHRKANK